MLLPINTDGGPASVPVERQASDLCLAVDFLDGVFIYRGEYFDVAPGVQGAVAVGLDVNAQGNSACDE